MEITGFASLDRGTDRDSSANMSASADHLLTTDPVLARIPRRIAPSYGGYAMGRRFEGGRYFPCYRQDGSLWFIQDTETGKEVRLPPEPPTETWQEGVDRYSRAEHRPTSVVYFVGDVNIAIKIGFSRCFSDRLKAIQACSPIPLKVLATIKGSEDIEMIYHGQFAAHRLHGEWFAPAQDILDEIDRLNSPPVETSRPVG